MPERKGEAFLRRAYPFEARAEEEGSISGVSAVYEQRTNIGDWFYEVIERGAFDAADLTDVPLFVNHDERGVPLARSRRNTRNSTLQLSVTEKGLEFRTKLDIEKNPKAAELYSAVLRGDVSGMSYAFTVKAEEWQDLDSEMPVRRIKSIAKVWEISAVTFPAYTGTEITARDRASLENDAQALENARNAQNALKNGENIALWKEKNRILGGF